MTVSVRPATRADDATLLALDALAWTPQAGFPSVMARSAATFFAEDTDPGRYLLARADGGDVVGYLHLGPAYPMPEAAHVMAITGLAVHPDARRHGVGTALLGAAEDTARSHGAHKIVLHVFATNATARRLYQRHGYVEEGRLVREFLIEGHWVDDLSLARWLD